MAEQEKPEQPAAPDAPPGAKQASEMPRVLRLEESQIEWSEYNANAEDSSTNARLRRELEAHGMLQLPVVQQVAENRFRMVGGEHRAKAWLETHSDVPVIVTRDRLEAEEEFNVVQNLNLVRGKVTLGRLRRVVQERKLDLKKVDLHGVPPWMLGAERAEPFEKQQQRKAHELAVKQLALSIATGLATMILEERDANGLLVCEAGEKVVLLAGFGTSVKWLRAHREDVKFELLQALQGMEGWKPGEYDEDSEEEAQGE